MGVLLRGRLIASRGLKFNGPQPNRPLCDGQHRTSVLPMSSCWHGLARRADLSG